MENNWQRTTSDTDPMNASRLLVLSASMVEYYSRFRIRWKSIFSDCVTPTVQAMMEAERDREMVEAVVKRVEAEERAEREQYLRSRCEATVSYER